MSGQGTARSFSATLRVRCDYLNSKLFHSYAFKEHTFLLTKCFTKIFSLSFLKISGWATAHKDEPLLFATEAREDLDGSTRWGNPSKSVQKTAPVEPGNPIHVIAANLPHKRRRQCTHCSPSHVASDGQISWMKPLKPPQKRETESVKNTRWSVQTCNHLDAKTEMRRYQRGMYECHVNDRCTMWMYRTKSCSYVLLEPHKKQFAVYIYSTVHFMKNLKTAMHKSRCVLWTWWNV